MKIVDDFEAAVDALAFKGAADPRDWEEIQANYENAKRKLLNALDQAKVERKKALEDSFRSDAHIASMNEPGKYEAP